MPVVSGAESGRRPRAPGALGLVQGFVNTNDLEGGHDLVATPRELAGWLTERTRWPVSAVPTAEEHARALVVREGLRDLAQQRDPGPGLASAVRALDIRMVVEDWHLRSESPTRLGTALAPVLDAVRAAMGDGTWARLKVCERDRCRWLFYDFSRNASGKWCTTDLCGSREKARRAYQRKRTPA